MCHFRAKAVKRRSPSVHVLLQGRGPQSVVPSGAAAASPGNLLEMYLPGPGPDLQDRKLCPWNHGSVF